MGRFLYYQTLISLVRCSSVVMLTACSVIFTLTTTSAVRIGVLGAPYLSHYLFMKNIAKELLTYNHSVAVIIPEYLEVNRDLDHEQDVITYRSYTADTFSRHMNLIAEMIYNRGDVRSALIKSNRESCEQILRDTQLLDNLRSRHFDFFIVDAVPPARLLTVIPYRLNVPFMYVGVGYHPWLQSIPHAPSFTPYSPFTLGDKMNLKQRVINTLISMAFALFDPFSARDDVALFAPERPFITMVRLVGHAQMWILDTNEIIDYARPTMPNVKQIGGLGIVLPKPLTGNLKHFMEGATEGVVLVSFGSIFKEEGKYLDTFLKSFESLPYKVVWRVEYSFQKMKNIYTSPWIPQSDILAHSNTKVFVTHCGNNGQFEALYHGVPMIGMPLFGDQPYNAARMVAKGYGIHLDFSSVSSEQLASAITELIENSTYQKTIQQASAAYRSQLRNELPRKKAAFWIDHVTKHGGAYMRSSAQDMVWYEYLSIDVIAIFVVCLQVIIFFSVKLTRCVFRNIMRRCKKAKRD